MSPRLLPLLLMVVMLPLTACCATDSAQQPTPETPVTDDDSPPPTDEAQTPIPLQPHPAEEDCGPAKVDLDALPPVTLAGTLKYTEIAPRKSVEAYMGVEFTLVTSDGEHVLKATDRVSREALVALDGKAVEVVGVLVKPRKPCPWEQYPTGMNGEPLERPDAYHLLSAKAR